MSWSGWFNWFYFVFLGDLERNHSETLVEDED
jgi:hypothetical protein